MARLKGGKGKKAPWDSTHVRCPVPIRDEVQARINEWKDQQLSGEESTEEPKPVNDLEEAIEIAKKS